MRKMHILSSLVAVSLLTTSTAFAEVKVTMQEGRVSIVAKDATVRQILTEWARVGQTKIVNVERIPGGPMTLELTNVPEQQALDLLLRSVSGFMAAPRAAAVANLSQFDRIVVMPTSAAPRPPMGAQPGMPTPTFAQPQFTPPVDDDVEDDRPAPNVPMPNGPIPNPRAPVFNTFPQPQVVNPQMPPMTMPGAGGGVVGGVPQQMPAQQPAAQPNAGFGGVAVPGMVVQPPQQPGQPGQVQPVIPGQPRRPGGPESR
jgi:hypothetical protein